MTIYVIVYEMIFYYDLEQYRFVRTISVRRPFKFASFKYNFSVVIERCYRVIVLDQLGKTSVKE